MLALLALMVWTLSAGGFDLLDLALTGCFALTLPFAVVGFWNAAVGFLIARFAADPVALTCPPAAAGAFDTPIAARTALVVCLRNEDVDAVFLRLSSMLDGLIRAGVGDRFTAAILSDTSLASIALDEERAFGRISARYAGRFDITYRRRQRNHGFKAGNIEDFCQQSGADFDFMLVLDADSFMSGATMLRLIRTMEAAPRLGILQSLVVGTPSVSPFARVFQFGMRFGMRSFTLGSAWWQADCGPYWGHNAIVRMKPFVEHCRLPRIEGSGPLSGYILSHDQYEAALMRRAGYEIRVLPVETESYEENPPSLVEFVRRELRWCHGNLQYLRLLSTPGLAAVSRIQLLLAAFMFVGSAAWIVMMVLITAGVAVSGGAAPMFHAEVGLWLFLAIMTMAFAPKLATTFDILVRGDERRRFGGLPRLAAGVAAEWLFTALVAPVVALSVGLFVLALPFGKRMTWTAQQRGTQFVPPGLALKRFWPHLVVGLAMFGGYASVSIDAAYLAAPVLVGLVLAVPLTTLTSSRQLGRVLARLGAFRIPEEVSPPAVLAPLALEAHAAVASGGHWAAHDEAGVVAEHAQG